MMAPLSSPVLGLPLLLVIEGENDIHFLSALSAMLHQADAQLPDLAQLAKQRQIIFLPTGGSNFREWATRLRGLNKRQFYLVDREQEPETTFRLQAVEFINAQPGSVAVMTRKRAVENYLHPQAIRQVCGLELSFDDDTDVASFLAHQLLSPRQEIPWRQLPIKRQKRLHKKVKKTLNVKAVRHMTPALLAEQDKYGEVKSWLETIQGMLETRS